MSKVAPEVEIIVSESEAEYKEATKEGRNQNSGGTYVDGKIYINPNRANKRTVAHEVFHALLLSKGRTDQQAQAITERMMEAVKKNADQELLDRLEKFSSDYENALQSEESIAELMGILAEGYPKLNTEAKSLIKRWLDRLAKIFGIKPLTSDADIINFLNTVSGKIASGQDIEVEDVQILNGNVSGVINGNQRKQKSILTNFKLKRFPTNPNIKLSEDVPLSTFNNKKSNLLESDRMTGAFISDSNNNPAFKFFGGIYFPQITGKWWASRTISKANSIADSMNANRDKDGYIYATPIIMKPNSHMSNQDMFETVWEFMKVDLRSKSNKVTKDLLQQYLTKALKLKSVNLTESDLKVNKSDSLEAMIKKLDNFLIGENNTLSFDKRKSIIKSILGDPKATEERKFPTAGSISEVANKFEEEKTKQATKLWDIVMIMRTKGNLSAKVTPKSDEFYHKSYPSEISSDKEIEVFFLDGAYNIDATYPKLTKSSGGEFSWKEYSERHPSAAFALSQYGRTAKLSKASGDIVAEPQSRKQKSDRPSIAEVLEYAKKENISEKETIEFLKEEGYTDAEISGKLKVSKPKVKTKRPTGNQPKSFVNRAFLSEGINERSRKKLKELGLDYTVESQSLAQKNAEKIIEEIGIEQAYKLAKEGQIRGGARTWIKAQMFEELNERAVNASVNGDTELAEALSYELALIMDEFSDEQKMAGQEAAMLNRIYQNFNMKYDVKMAKKSWKRMFGKDMPTDVEARLKAQEKKNQ